MTVEHEKILLITGGVVSLRCYLDTQITFNNYLG